jgi:hypothetical protein
MNLYLNTGLHHKIPQTRRTFHLGAQGDRDSLHDDMEFLKVTFKAEQL